MALETNTLVPYTAYQQLPKRTYVEMIATHRYSLSSMLHPQVIYIYIYIYAVAFSAGLNGLQVD